MRSIFIIPIFIFLLSACTPAGKNDQPWQLSDLRLLEIPDTNDPTSDLIAIYTRQTESSFQIRLDLLDMKPDLDVDLYVLLDTIPSIINSNFPINPPAISSSTFNQRWDLLLFLPHNGFPQAFPSGSHLSIPVLSPRVQRDPLQDSVTISLNRNIIPNPQNLTFQVFLTSEEGITFLDQSPLISDVPLKTKPTAPIIIAFSDSFPAFTPAQALRHWDGAHTGPTGERHGLKHILTNAEIYNIPVILLDLKDPVSISALDFMGAVPQVQHLQQENLLLLPDISLTIPDAFSQHSSQEVASVFSFHSNNFIYSADGKIQTDYNFQFMDLPDRTHLLDHAGITLIPLPDLAHKNVLIQASDEGLTLEIRRQLLATALSPDPTDLVILGGSLPYSSWGDSDISKASMAYISAHPWIQPLNSIQIQSFHTQPVDQFSDPQISSLPSFPIFNSQGDTIGLDSIQLHDQLLRTLQNSPKNIITNLAWQMFKTLTSPSTNPAVNQLHYQYLNQVTSMLAASRWLESPTSISDCSQDIDLDLVNECILSNTRFFAVIELDGGRLSFLFERDGHQAHQLIGPLSQFFVGLSDPSLWEIEQGPGADPAEIPGAFSDSDKPFLNYEIIEMKDGLLILKRSDGQIDKVFNLYEHNISIEVNSNSILSTKIPLAVDPQVRFQPGWKNLYYSQTSPNSFKWGVLGSTTVEINTISTFSSYDFNNSSSQIIEPENPDLDYPPGHFLPFPVALIEISGNDFFLVNIQVNQ